MTAEEDAEKEILRFLKSGFPGILIKSYEVLESGWENIVALVNGEIAFKIPRDGKDNKLQREIDITDCLSESPIPVPSFAYAGSHEGMLMAGYHFIKGEKLNSVNVLKPSVLQQLSDFLNYLYEMSETPCVTKALKPLDRSLWKEKYHAYSETIFSSLFQILDDKTLSVIATGFGEFLTEYCETLQTSLIHGDLYRGNVLINEFGDSITGVIDWGTSSFGDPAIDFAALAVDFDMSQVDEILSMYKGRVDRNFKKRLEFYWQLEPTYGLLYFAEKDHEAFLYEKKELIRRFDEGLF